MLSSFCFKPLGLILQEADLVSLPQLELALSDQYSYQNLKIGEIMALRGWIEQNTADFFAEKWHDLVQEKARKPLGYYLQEANLLKEEQINVILQEQKQSWLRFGAVAVLKGWITQNTLDFFLYNLFPTKVAESAFIGKRKTSQQQPNYYSEQTLILKTNLNNCKQKIEEMDYEDIPWLD